ncbi:hypothetical protein MSC49_14900 [Methylosinus sp. C49]|nr:hypothetical protein MSC49_14900 [Methylosinus sp. C49]
MPLVEPVTTALRLARDIRAPLLLEDERWRLILSNGNLAYLDRVKITT